MPKKRTELGCIGHFICGERCRWRRHTQVGHYRVSSVGDFYRSSEGKRETLGAGDDSFFETMVFPTSAKPASHSEGCGCCLVKSWSAIDSKRYATAGEAQRGHEAFVRKYARKAK